MLKRSFVITHGHGVIVTNRQMRARFGYLILVIVRQPKRGARDALKLLGVDAPAHVFQLIHRIRPTNTINFNLRNNQRRFTLEILIAHLCCARHDVTKHVHDGRIPSVGVPGRQRVHRHVIHRSDLIHLRMWLAHLPVLLYPMRALAFRRTIKYCATLLAPPRGGVDFTIRARRRARDNLRHRPRARPSRCRARRRRRCRQRRRQRIVS